MSAWGPPCDDSSRTSIRLFGQRFETWHEKGVYPVKYAELLALRTKYGQLLQRRQEAGNTTDVQTYACRSIRGSSSYSYHSWPRALDIRPAFNPMRDDGVFVSDFDKYGLLDGVRFVGAFLAAGFDWGATWDDTDGASEDERCRLTRRTLLRNGEKISSGRIDPMHFELDDDSDVWTTKRALRKLRAYRARHPIYVAQVLKDANADNLRELLVKWKKGDA